MDLRAAHMAFRSLHDPSHLEMSAEMTEMPGEKREFDKEHLVRC